MSDQITRDHQQRQSTEGNFISLSLFFLVTDKVGDRLVWIIVSMLKS